MYLSTAIQIKNNKKYKKVHTECYKNALHHKNVFLKNLNKLKTKSKF